MKIKMEFVVTLLRKQRELRKEFVSVMSRCGDTDSPLLLEESLRHKDGLAGDVYDEIIKNQEEDCDQLPLHFNPREGPIDITDREII